jgi:hypothetical protein
MHVRMTSARGAARAVTAVMLLATAVSMVGPAVADTLADRRDQRVLMHRNAPRGLEYVPTARAGRAGKAKSTLRVDVLKKINLDGNALDNAYSNLVPADTNGNGRYEFVHWNGHRIMRTYDQRGAKLWQVTNGSARKQGSSTYIHRDDAAVLDLDGDRKDDILHCWQSGSTKRLVARDGATGRQIRHVNLSGQSNTRGSFCRMAVYRKEKDRKPIILVAHNQPGGSSKCGRRNWVDNWTRVVAYDLKLKRLWHTDTCDAGHQTAGVDADGDGSMEHFFAGKYALDFNGKIRCTLSGWAKNDHADGIRVAKLDPRKRTVHAIAIGRTGGGAYDARTCKRLWKLPSVVKNPQHIVVGQFDPAPRPLSLMIAQRNTRPDSDSFVINAEGRVARTIRKREIMGMQNANLDGDPRTDEIVSMFGEVFNGRGDRILSKNWYWGLKGSKVKERKGTSYDKWVAYPLLFDVDNDGREEMVTWGQSLIVVGRPR